MHNLSKKFKRNKRKFKLKLKRSFMKMKVYLNGSAFVDIIINLILINLAVKCAKSKEERKNSLLSYNPFK